MIDLSKILYSPIIRTRRAELVGLAEVDPSAARSMLPLFELTRSRRTKSNPGGSVELSVSELIKIVDEGPFVADVTTLLSLSNPEVDSLLDPAGRFRNWVTFVEKNLPRSAIPIVHITDPYDSESVAHQSEAFLRRHDFVAIRIPSEFSEVDSLVETLTRTLGTLSRVVIYADSGLVTERGLRGARARAGEIAVLVSGAAPALFVPASSSFPGTVTPFGDVTGVIPLHEVAISEFLKEEFEELPCIHGDYACIHPREAEGIAINWVPRVDVPLDDSIFYYRYRRPDGGYVRAAEAAIRDSKYEPLKCWANENVKLAATGNPAGKAPAFWISVRLNFHIERQLARLA